MASRRIVVSGLIRAARPSLSQRPIIGNRFSPNVTANPAQPRSQYRIRQNSQTAQPPSKAYSFEDIQSLTTNPRPKTLLIDVREPDELRLTGRIPTALNIPITTSPDGLFLSEEAFEERFGFPKPGLDTELVFYCKAGVRSRAAAGMARDAGWKTGEYKGSWMDWEEKGGAKERMGKGSQ